jgi:uncharacterized protein YlaI
MNFTPEAKCALCQRVAELKNSHIIPEFLFGTLYDEKNRFHTFGKEGQPEAGLEQKGYRERLLCAECEQRFSNYERVAAVFYRGTIEAFASPRSRSAIREKAQVHANRRGFEAHFQRSPGAPSCGWDRLPRAEALPALAPVADGSFASSLLPRGGLGSARATPSGDAAP